MAHRNPLQIRLVMCLTCGDWPGQVSMSCETADGLRYQAGNGQRSLARSRSSSSAPRLWSASHRATPP